MAIAEIGAKRNVDNPPCPRPWVLGHTLFHQTIQMSTYVDTCNYSMMERLLAAKLQGRYVE